MRKHSFEEIALIDQALFNLAKYDVTSGLIAIVTTQQASDEIWGKIIRRFNYFKVLIQRGTCSFDFIKNTVLDAHGPFFHAKPKNIDKLLDDPDFCKEDENELMEKSDNLLRNIFLSQCFPKKDEPKY